MQIATEIYTCKPTARIVAPLLGDVAANRFLLSTASVGDDNEIHVVEYNTKNRTVFSERIYKHNGQIFGLSPCPYDPQLCFVIVGCESDTKKGVLVRLENLSISDVSEDKDSDAKATEPLPQPEEATPEPNPENPPAPEESAPKEALEGDSKEEEAVTEISEDKECIPDDKKDGVTVEEKPTQLTTLATAPRDSIVCAIWHPGNLEEGTLPHELILVYRSGYAGYQVGNDGALSELFFYSFKEPCQCAAWDPLHTHLLAVGQGCDLRVIDISDNSMFAERTRIHIGGITCMEFNPNRPSTLCTGGKDGMIHIWHVSGRGITPEKSILAHSHWVSSVHFNPIQDQLLLSSSTDSVITLWRLFSVSSVRLKEKQQEDKKVMSLGGTRSSVYSTAWSPKNLWLFCGASYEGKLLFGSVPAEEVAVLLDEI